MPAGPLAKAMAAEYRNLGEQAAEVADRRHNRAVPQVAVVIAARNMEAFIGSTIESVLAQTLDDFEMIVVDDGSEDATGRIVTAVDDPRMRLISIPSSGPSVARNAGLAAALAPLVVFLDADDLLCPDALAQMVATMATHRERVACFGHHVKIDERGRLLGGGEPARFKTLPAHDTLRHLLCRNFIANGGAVCVRTGAARRVGGYDPTLRYSEDLEFWCRLAAISDFANLGDRVVLQYRMRPSGANVTLAGSAFRPNLVALDKIFAAPAVRSRFSTRERRVYRRLAEANKHWSAARNALTQNRLLRFTIYLLAGALRYPESLLRWRLIYVFLRGLPLAWRTEQTVTGSDRTRPPSCSRAPSSISSDGPARR
jgi:glycosyltransferase involved in cell wall biosynthesis